MARKSDSKIYDDINVTPMLDVAYTLLIIFIIITTVTVQGIKVNLPKASDTPSLGESGTKAITVTQDGTVYLDTYPMTLPELESSLGQHLAVDPGLPVVIKADGIVQYQQVVEVLDIAGRLGIRRLGLVTEKLTK